MRRIYAEYKNGTQADFSYYSQQQGALNDFRGKMANVDPEYLKSFDAARGDRATAEAMAFKMEQDSAAATLALYQYAAEHAREITIKNGQLTFSTEGVRVEFSSQLARCKTLYSSWQAVVQELAKRQQQARAATSPSVN
jgi:hypothetical protein